MDTTTNPKIQCPVCHRNVHTRHGLCLPHGTTTGGQCPGTRKAAEPVEVQQ